MALSDDILEAVTAEIQRQSGGLDLMQDMRGLVIDVKINQRDGGIRTVILRPELARHN